MVGRPAAVKAARRFFAPTTEPAMGIESLSVDMPGERVDDVTLAVRRGEILGIGGLAGHGKLGIANGVMGLYPAWGRVIFGEKLFPLNEPREAAAARVGLRLRGPPRRGPSPRGIDRAEHRALRAGGAGALPPSIADPALQLLNHRAMRAHALEMIKALDIRTTGPSQQVRRLSEAISRGLRRSGDDPPAQAPLCVRATRGIDVGRSSSCSRSSRR